MRPKKLDIQTVYRMFLKYSIEVINISKNCYLLHGLITEKYPVWVNNYEIKFTFSGIYGTLNDLVILKNE